MMTKTVENTVLLCYSSIMCGGGPSFSAARISLSRGSRMAPFFLCFFLYILLNNIESCGMINKE